MNNKFILIFVLLLLTQSIKAQMRKPFITEIDRIRLAEAFKIGSTLGNKVWSDWNDAPFAVLLVTPEQEFLIGNPKPSAEFLSNGYDALLQSEFFFTAKEFSARIF